MSAGKGKRGADGPLTTTSSSSDEDSPRCHPVVKQNLEQKLEKNSEVSINFHTCNADRFLSKAGSLATPRTIQAHQTQHSDRRRPQLKKKRGDFDKEEPWQTKLQVSTPRNMQQREPLPMRMRALPHSFWQQPNRSQIPPATVYPVLPPLVSREVDDISDFGPAALLEENSEEDRGLSKGRIARGVAVTTSFSKATPSLSERRRQSERSITVTNTELLSKLFEVIEEDAKKPNHDLQIRRLRTRKSTLAANPTGTKFLSSRDPYMIDSITEKLFPQLSLESSKSYTSYGGNTRLQLLTLKDGDRIVALPSIAIDQNYPQMLSELVTHI